MKTRTLITILILVLAVLIIVGSCATSKKSYISEDNLINELTGTWYNEEYETQLTEKMPQLTVYSDVSLEWYKEYAEMTTPSRLSGQFISIKKAWTDHKGNIWYQAKLMQILHIDYMYYEIGKISGS